MPFAQVDHMHRRQFLKAVAGVAVATAVVGLPQLSIQTTDIGNLHWSGWSRAPHMMAWYGDWSVKINSDAYMSYTCVVGEQTLHQYPYRTDAIMQRSKEAGRQAMLEVCRANNCEVTEWL